MKHKIEIAPNNAIYIDGERTIGSKPYGLFLTTTIIVSDDDLKRLADRCLAVIADRKPESNSGKPNNCEDCIWSVCNYNKAFEDEPNSSEKPNNCEHITEDGVTCAKYPACDDCLDNPLNKEKGSERLLKGKDEPQTEAFEEPNYYDPALWE